MCGPIFQFKSFFMDTTTAFCVKLKLCVCVCVGVLKGSLSDEQVLVGEKFYLFLQQVVPGEAPILKMITSVPITSARLSPDP